MGAPRVGTQAVALSAGRREARVCFKGVWPLEHFSVSHGVGHFLPEAASGVTAQSGSAHSVLSACSALGPTTTEGSVSPRCGSPSEGRCHLGEEEGGGLSLSSPTSWLLL